MVKIKYPETDAEKARLYVHAMLEIKERIEAANAILTSDMIPLFKNELCQLHVRHICEVISIACLAAQGDYKTQRAFTEEYSPPKIFNALRRLYTEFFPIPCTVTTTSMADGCNHHHLATDTVPGAYTERDITRAWSTAGNYLHRTSVKKYLSTTMDKPPPPLEPVRNTLQGIANLIAHHVVAVRYDGPRRTLLEVTLDNGEGMVAARFLRLNTDESTISVEEFHGSVIRK